jgi:hypothetical protein
MKKSRLVGLLWVFGASLFISTPAFSQDYLLSKPMADLKIYCNAISPLLSLSSGADNLRTMQAQLDRKDPKQRPIFNALDKKIRGIASAIRTIKGATFRAAADLVRDGRIDQDDVDAFSACYFSNPTPGRSTECAKADVDGNGALTLSDLSFIAGYKGCYERALTAAEALAEE